MTKVAGNGYSPLLRSPRLPPTLPRPPIPLVLSCGNRTDCAEFSRQRRQGTRGRKEEGEKEILLRALASPSRLCVPSSPPFAVAAGKGLGHVAWKLLIEARPHFHVTSIAKK